MLSQTTETRQKVYAAHAKCELLEEQIIVQFAWLKNNTSAPGTLEVTEDQQYTGSVVCYTFQMKPSSVLRSLQI